VARLRGGIEFVKRGHVDGSEARAWLVQLLVCMQVGWHVRIALALHHPLHNHGQPTTLAAKYPRLGWLQCLDRLHATSGSCFPGTAVCVVLRSARQPSRG